MAIAQQAMQQSQAQSHKIRRGRHSLKVMPNGDHPRRQADPEGAAHLTEEKLRKWLKHPTAGGFPTEGPANWPRDSFTFARIRDGDVTVVDADDDDK
jgi:hypothetical protein